MSLLRRLGPLALDRVLAGVLFAVGQLELVGLEDVEGPWALNALGVALATLPFAFRRRHTLPVVGVVMASVVTMTAVFTPVGDLFVLFVVAMALCYSVGAYTDGRRSLVGLAIMVAGILFVSTMMPSQIVGDYVFPTAFGIIAWLAGRAVRTRTQLTEELHEEAVRAREAHEREALRAAAEERRRIAREMHDVVAHSVSVMVVQAGGARRILERDPERAVAAAEQIERTGREALAEMRRLLGVLHPDDEPPELAPQPTMGGVDELVERARGAGLPVTLREEGERRPLPAGLDLTAYRIVQEGLTNVLKHAPKAATEVRVRWGDRELELEVADRGSGPGSATADGTGHGLVGMRERARVFGGEIDSGRRPGGGFYVRARLPLVADEQEAAVA